ncbi:MAG TPA: glycosyltransferase, partial [Thermoanaerobaculia bacterium]|nr:glycosyltransferase [Thermoanaerobaculia bacterium]
RERRHELGAARSVLTLYTPEEPNRFGRSTVERLGLAAGLFHPHLLEERGGLSFLKGGAAFADTVVLPSLRAAREVVAGGAKPGGVEGGLAARGAELRGILHGLDTARWNPQRDDALAAPFSAGRPAGKARCKAALQSELGLLTDAKAALFVFAGEMTAAAGFDLLLEALPKLTAPPFGLAQWALVGRGDRALEQRARAAARAHRGTVAVALEPLEVDERLARRVLGAADFVLFPARRAWDGTWALRALRYGALPVAHATGALAEIVRPVADDDDAEGNGVVFRTLSAAALARAAERALALYGTPRLRRLRRAAIESNPSWAGAVRRYEQVFRELGKRAPRRVEIPDLPPEPLTAEPTEPYIDWGPPLPERYGEDALELLVQSPRSLYLYWELAATTLAAAGGDIRLRLREAGPVDAVRDLASGLPEVGEWWLEAEPGRAYRAELVAGDGRVLRRSAEAATPREAPAQRGEARWVSHTPPAPAPSAGAPRGHGATGSRTGARGRGEAPPPSAPGAPPEVAAAAQSPADAADALDAIDAVERPVEPLSTALEPTAAPSSAAPPRPPGSSDLAARRSGR